MPYHRAITSETLMAFLPIIEQYTMDEQLKEKLVNRFRHYLDTDFDLEGSECGEDQYTLFGELAGLKNEVRIESRQLKSALDDFREAFSSLDNANHSMSEMFLQVQSQEKERTGKALIPLIFGLIDLYDRLAAGLELKPSKRTFLQSFFPGKLDDKWLQAYLDGQKMILERVLDLLHSCEVRPFDVLAKPFDPTVMKAIQFETDHALANGLVLRETRKGFFQNTKVIRPAEVIVNKI